MRCRLEPCSLCRLVLAGPLLLGVACHPSGGQRQQLDSRNPLERAQAVVRLADERDPAAVPKLVDLLEDRDPAVRMYAILALERLCGANYGYRYYGREAERAEAVRRWRAALRDGTIVIRSGSLSPMTAPEDQPPAELATGSSSAARLENTDERTP